MKRTNPKKTKRHNTKKTTHELVDQEFWRTYELFVTALIYELIVTNNLSMQKVSEIMESIGALIGEVHDKRMTLEEFKEWVGDETNIDMKEVFS